MRRIVLIGMSERYMTIWRFTACTRSVVTFPKNGSNIFSRRCKPMTRSEASSSFMLCDNPLTTFTLQRLCVCILTWAAAATRDARSNILFPLFGCSSSCSRTIFIADSGAVDMGRRTISAKFTRLSAVSGLLNAMTMRSSFSLYRRESSFSSLSGRLARLLAIFSVVKELNMQLTRIRIIAPLRTSSPSRWEPSGSIMLFPTITMARVAAARLFVRPKSSIPSRLERW